MRNFLKLIVFLISLGISWSSQAYSIYGTIFEDQNFSGVIRPHDWTNMYEREHTRIDVYKNGHYQKTVWTNLSGYYSIDYLENKQQYTLKVFLSESERGTNTCYSCEPIMVWPVIRDVLEYTVSINHAHVNLDLGFNFNTVSNLNDSGAGSLRQVLHNLSYINDDSSLWQTCSYCVAGKDNVIFKLDSVSPNKTIHLHNPINTSVNSSGQDDTYLDATGLGVHIQPVANGSGAAFEVTRSSRTKIAGLDIDGFDYAFKIHNCSASDCDIELSNNGISNSKINAIHLSGVNEVTIKNNTIDGTGHAAISLFNADDNDIEGNSINRAFVTSADRNDASAILLQGNESCTADRNDCNDGSSDNDIEGNTISNTGLNNPNLASFDPFFPSAVRIYQGWENEISKNNFSNNIGISIDFATYLSVTDPNDGAYNNSHSHNGIDFPTITDVTKSGNTLTVKGFVGQGSASAVFDDFDVEIYQGELSSLGRVQGSQFLHRCGDDDDSVEEFGNGVFECSFLVNPSTDVSNLTAVIIDDDENTSEFGSLWFGRDYDYGDAPNEDLATGWEDTRFPVMSADNGARHAINEDVCLYPGVIESCAFSLDEENDGQPNRDASADEEDDGVEFNPSNSELVNSELNVLITSYFDKNRVEKPFVNELVVTASENGYVSVWVDKNQDGSWDGFERNKQFVSEKVIDGVSVNQGENKLNLVLSAYDVHGESWVRVRYSTDQNSVKNPSGAALDGEVEDYQVWIAAPSMGIAGCEAGLQNGSFEIFYTEDGHNGWDTPESSVAGWSIYQQDPALDPHSEPYGQRRNHIEFNTYNAYVYEKSSDGSMNVAEMNVYHPTVMYQDIVTTPGDRIRWSFDYSNRTYPNSANDDQISLMFGAPNHEPTTEQVIDGEDRWVEHSGSYQVPAGQYVTRIAFKGNKPVGGSAGNILDNAQFGCDVGKDFGDLPNGFAKETSGILHNISDDGKHIEPMLFIGSEPADAELSANYSAIAKGDDGDGFNDEFTFSTPLIISKGSQIKIASIPIKNATGHDAVLRGYLDVTDTQNNAFETIEQADTIVSSTDAIQSVVLEWDLNGAQFTSGTQVFLRLELSGTDKFSESGEIEDHLVYLVDDNVLPQPGRCDGFVQVKESGFSGKYQYAKWNVEAGEIAIDEINSSLNASGIKVIGVSQRDGMTYGAGSPLSKKHELYVADQQEGAEFNKLADIKAAYDGVYIRSALGHTYTFDEGDLLDASLRTDQGAKNKLGKLTSGDVSPDGRYLIAGRSAWHSILRIDLSNGTFDSVQLNVPNNKDVPWSADFAFDLSGNSPGYVYGISKDLKTLYKISISTGDYEAVKLTLVVESEAPISKPEWPTKDADGKISSGGFGINKGGILFAMTNGGIHDLDQDGKIEDWERNNSTTALYSIDIANRTIRFEMKGKEEATSSNDAGGCSVHADYGDVPSVLEGGNPAVHFGGKEILRLGNAWSADLGPGNDENASADLSDDGVTFKDALHNSIDVSSALFTPGHQYTLEPVKKGGGVATAWASWNGVDWQSLPSMSFIVPNNKSVGYVRVRYASTKVNTPFGEAPDGEVEDYRLNIGSAVKGVSVSAPSSPLTCEVAQYQVVLDVEGGNLSQDVSVDVGFDNAPAQCWFDAHSFNRGQEAGKANCSTDTRSLLFGAGGSLTRTIWVATDSELKDVTLVATQQDIGSARDGARFTKEGFKIIPDDVPVHYKAGETFKVRLERKVAIEDQVQCSIDPDYLGAKTFAFNHETADTYKGKLTLNGTEVVSDTDITLNFNAGVSDAIDGVYFESGYLNILAEYLPEEGLPKTASLDSPLHFKPYSLIVSDVGSTDDTVSNPQDLVTRFIPAEAEFDIQLSAVAKGHSNDAPLITRNFDGALADSDGFEANVVVPSSQVGPVSDLSPSTPNTRVFTGGVLENTFTYANVGTIDMRWVVESYDGYGNLAAFLNTDLSIENGGERSQAGYFYPAKFVLSSDFSVPTTRADNSEPWTYYGQPNVSAEVETEAVGVQNGSLSFYDAETLASNELPSLASIDVYFDGDLLPSCLMDEGVLIDNAGSSIDFEQAWQGGRWEINAANYAFARLEGCWQQLNDVNLFMDQSNSENSPLVDESDTVLDNSQLELGDAVDVRFGRLTLVDVAGPIEQLLPMAINLEFWDGERFAANDWHSESSLESLGEFPGLDDLAPQPAEPSGATPIVMVDSLPLRAVDQGESSTAIGASEAGVVELPWAFATGTENWLGYCWYTVDGITDECGDEESYRQPPSGTATFGVNRGSENIIYIMERFE